MLRAKSLLKPFARRCSNVPSQDQEQLNLFNKLGGAWWHDPALNSLRNINKVRIPMFRNFIVPIHGDCRLAGSHRCLTGIKMLEVGCGGGFLTEGLAKLGANITGLDTAGDAIAAAKEHATLDPELAKNLKYEAVAVEDWVKKYPAKYDVVVSSEVIEHVNVPEQFLTNCLACLRPGGSMILTTMAKTWIGGFSNIFICENITSVIPKGVHEYSKFIRAEDLQKLLLLHKCSTLDVKGFWINCYTAESHHVPVTWFNYAIHAVKH